MRKYSLALIGLLFFAVAAIAQVASPTPLPVVIPPADPTWLVNFGQWVSNVPTSGYVVALLTFVLDFTLRVVKTQRPLSILYLASHLFTAMAAFFHTLATIADGILMKVGVPQNASEPAQSPVTKA